jgi:hypothetical protein
MIVDMKQKEPHERKIQKHIEEWYKVVDSKCWFDEEKEKICLVNLLLRNSRTVGKFGERREFGIGYAENGRRM